MADPVQATKTALRRIARRCQQLDAEITDADAELRRLTRQAAAQLLECCGVGPQVAGQLLVTAGDNPDRIHNDAALAALCGASPVPVSSGRTHRVRLNRGGDRDANSALYTIAVVRMRHHEPTRAPTSNAAAPKERPPKRSSAASNEHYAESSSPSSNKPSPPTPLDKSGL